ncbi:MAG TPA: hypothetical protein VF942_17545, partial [Acidimicrobiales bacterium]
MRSLKVLVILSAWFVLAAPSSPSPIPTPSPAPTPSPTPTPSPSPSPVVTPTPTAANIVLDFAAGGPGTRITVSGTYFLANESMSLYWDTPS